MDKVTAILLAGGKSTRFDPENLKTLYEINGKTLTELVIEDIKKTKLFDEIVLVYNKKNKKEFAPIIKKTGVKSAPNGDTRFMSAHNGLMEATNEKLLFIDVAAPFYQEKMLKEMIERLDNFAGVITSVFDSRADHIQVKGDKVVKVFERGEILRVKSYQAVNRSKWIKAFDKSTDDQRSKYTEMLKVLIDNKQSVGNVTSENNPRKITTKEDLRFFVDEGWKK